MNKNILIVIVVVIALGLGFVFLSGGDKEGNTVSNQEEQKVDELDDAPSFSLKDYEGNTIALEDFKGKVVVANSWAVWCPFCVDELPDFGELQEEFGDRIAVIAINRAESLEKAQNYTNNFGLTDTYVFLLDPRDSFYKSIGGFSMPETLFIDGNGKIVIHKRGPMDLSEMRDKVNSILSR